MAGTVSGAPAAAFANLYQATLNGADVMLAGSLQYLEQKGTAKLLGGEGGTIPGVNKKIPSEFLPFGSTVGTGKGATDVFTGGPSISSAIPLPGDSQGTGDQDKDGVEDGREFVDGTQPHR